MRLVVAITGASGPVIAVRLLEELQPHEVHLVVTKAAERVIAHELGTPTLPSTYRYAPSQLDAPIASSSFTVDGMVVAPCSMKSLSAIALGYTNDLVARAADNVLRMKRRLVLVPRETPLSLAAIENMRSACLSGAVILPPAIAYYFEPRSIEDMTDFVVGKIMDSLEIPHELYRRWSGPPAGSRGPV
jgi:4-hydroxy-3-polyprenylbenzoate decarboxylase